MTDKTKYGIAIVVALLIIGYFTNWFGLAKPKKLAMGGDVTDRVNPDNQDQPPYIPTHLPSHLPQTTVTNTETCSSLLSKINSIHGQSESDKQNRKKLKEQYKNLHCGPFSSSTPNVESINDWCHLWMICDTGCGGYWDNCSRR